MDMPKAIIIAAAIIGGSIIASQGIYSFSSIHQAAAQRYNKFTGSVALCATGIGCIDLSKKEDKVPDFFIKE